jgi:hypothetical protein
MRYTFVLVFSAIISAAEKSVSLIFLPRGSMILRGKDTARE